MSGGASPPARLRSFEEGYADRVQDDPAGASDPDRERIAAARRARSELYTSSGGEALRTLFRLAPELIALASRLRPGDRAGADGAAEGLEVSCLGAQLVGAQAPEPALVRRVLAQARPRLAARLRVAWAPLVARAGRLEDAVGILDDVLAHVGRSERSHARALLIRGTLRRRHLDDLQGAERDARTALALALAYERPVHEVEALSNLSSLPTLGLEQRRQLARRALRLARADGNDLGALGPLGSLMSMAPPPPDPEGQVLAEEGLALSARVGFVQGVFVFGSSLARLGLELGQPALAEAARDEVLACCDRLGWDARRRQFDALYAVTAWSLDPAVDPRPALARTLLDPRPETHTSMLRAALAASSAEADPGARPRPVPDGLGHAGQLFGLAVAVWGAVGGTGVDEALLQQARDALQATDADAMSSVRLARRVLARAVAALEDARRAQVLTLGPGAEWFRVGGAPRVSLERRRILRVLLEALARAADPLSVPELFDQAWPGQQIRPDSAAHRVHVAIAELRKYGLGEVLETVDGGYRLSLPVRWEQP